MKPARKEPDLALRDRIAGSIDRDPVFGCHLWRGKPDVHGYGTLWTKAGPRQAHRAVYVELVGEPGEGLLLDHLCRRRRCVRPEHLEPVTERENQLRRDPGYLARRAACRNGHPLERPIRTPEGGLLCRVCQGPPRAATVGDLDAAAAAAEPAAVARIRAGQRAPHPLAALLDLDTDDEP